MPDFEIRRYPYADRYAVIAELDTKLTPGAAGLEEPARRLTEGEIVILVRVTPPVGLEQATVAMRDACTKIEDGLQAKGILPPSSSLCSRCHKRPSELEHTCPYQSEINNDDILLCDCCGACRDDCAGDI